MHLREFCFSIERDLQHVIDSCYPYEWDEDHITRSLLKQFRQYDQLELTGFKYTLQIKWETYKFTGTPEQDYGDIAILIVSTYRDGRKIEGVGFLEAKKRDRGSLNFSSLKLTQLKKIARNAPRSVVLLYDYEDITGFQAGFNPYAAPFEDFQLYDIAPYRLFQTHSVVVSSNLVISTGCKNTDLYKHSSPFSHQLCLRYFLGFDLEFTEKAVDTVKGYANLRNLPKFVMVIQIGNGVAPLPPERNINTNIYQPVE